LPAVSWAVEKAESKPTKAAAGARSRLDLNGQWERRIDRELYDVVQVPSSLRPSGYYHLKRQFLLPELSGHERAILHFDAITYFGRAFVNGAELGTMVPYVPFEFDFTRQARKGSNTVEVAIADLTPEPSGAGKDELALGLNPGWEAYGGIIRDVYAEVRPAAFVDHVRFGYKLEQGYARAACQAQVRVSSTTETSAHVEVVVLRAGAEVARAMKTASIPAGASSIEVTFGVTAPVLWSPEDPNLYQLRTNLKTEHGVDRWSCRTGFREVVTRGPDFLLNGRRLVLNGVCRHDLWKDQGFTLTRQQMQQDMRMIKGLGANFVRLVHYPHHAFIIQLADELGLLVSEEPGYWNMEFNKMPRSLVELGYGIMEKTIRRDGNSPSVFAWLLSNECQLTLEALREGKEICNRLDPIGRLVSVANSMPKEKAKPLFEQAGMDFFDQHPYTSNVDDFNREAEFDGPRRPLTFTEWGGKAIGQSQRVMQKSVDRLLDLVDSHQLAGHVFWSWQDLREYSRIDEEMCDGILESGVVTEGREPREVPYRELARLFGERRQEAVPAATQPLVLPPKRTQPANARPTVLPLKRSPATPGSSFQAVDLQTLVESAEGAKTWAALEAALAKYWPRVPMAEDQWKRTGEKFLLWQGPEVEIAGIPFHIPTVNNYVRPVLLMPETPEVTIAVGQECERLHVLGQVTFPVGYPVAGKRGERVATYWVRYRGGRERELPVRNGMEVAQANRINSATRIDPIATETRRALEYVKDIGREQYQVLLWSVPLERGRVESMYCKLEGEQPALSIFALTAEHL
jgi:beta-glucuronidase